MRIILRIFFSQNYILKITLPILNHPSLEVAKQPKQTVTNI